MTERGQTDHAKEKCVAVAGNACAAKTDSAYCLLILFSIAEICSTDPVAIARRCQKLTRVHIDRDSFTQITYYILINFYSSIQDVSSCIFTSFIFFNAALLVYI